MWRIFKWIVYSVALVIIGIVAARLIATSTPGELKNYIISSNKIERAYNISVDAKDEFKIYQIKLRSPFGLGDNLFINNVYYLENAENLQLTLRCKNSRFENLSGSFFKVYLKVTDTSGVFEIDVETGELNEAPENASKAWHSVILETVNQDIFGKNSNRYMYFVYSFDDVKINYADTKVELYVFDNSSGDITEFDEDKALARFTLFDVNMPKLKINAKKFKLG